jgi:hypothetical protein
MLNESAWCTLFVSATRRV